MSTSAPRTPGMFLEELPAGAFVRVRDLPGTADAAKSAASRAARSGMIVPVARGLYYKGEKTRYGMTTPTAEEVALEVTRGHGAGPAGVSAARALGLTTQVPAKPHLAVVGRVPGGLPGVHMEKRSNFARLELNYTEIALLETLRSWMTTVDDGWNALVSAVRARLASGGVDLDKLRRAAEGEHVSAVKDAFRRLMASLAGVVGAPVGALA